MKQLACAIAVLLACGAHPRRAPPVAAPAITHPITAADHLLALLPEGAQLVVEVDFTRLRANPVMGRLIAKVVGPGGIDRLAGFADADLVVFAAYGLGTAQAATITLMTSKQTLAGTTKIADGIFAVGPTEWIGQTLARAEIDRSAGGLSGRLTAPRELLDLREHAMPPNAPGASLRVSARLSFDARVSLSRITGIENAPGQLSVWADVADDFAVIVDSDSTDPGDKQPTKAVKRMKAIVEGALGTFAQEPTVVALGLPASLTQAKVVMRGTWVRTIVAIGPRHLERVVERASTFFAEPKP